MHVMAGPDVPMTRILIVEDNEMNRELLARRLRRRGYEVCAACDGQQGLDMARSAAVDLILMDLSLPVMDGWQATRRLKADPRTRSIPVIALTAHAMPGDREEALGAGCDDYDTKPVDFARLVHKIESRLRDCPG
jgi:CheY-like chemotaxis protein